ncbi:unnamed protein product, partial [Rotaria sordida]
VQLDYIDSSRCLLIKILITHVYNLYSDHGLLINITDLLFCLLSKDNTVLLTVSEHIESFCLINTSTYLIPMNILSLDLEQSLEDQ